VSSIEPNDGGGELNGGEEVSPGLVVSGGNGTKLLELGEEVLNQAACPVEIAIVIPGLAAIGLGGDHCRLACSGQRHDDPFIGVERFVADQHIGLHVRQQMIGADQIMRLTAGEEEVDGVAQRIDQGMDLGAQSAARATDRLVLAGFFWAPALC
jgi:hypothetical protein